MEYSRYFQDLSKPRNPSHTNSRDKESLNSSSTQAKPSHAKGTAKLEEQQHRQGAAVQPYPVDYITTPVALVQHCSGQRSGRGAAQRSSRHAAAAGRLRSISLVCVLHNTITLLLTAVKSSVKLLSKICQNHLLNNDVHR